MELASWTCRLHLLKSVGTASQTTRRLATVAQMVVTRPSISLGPWSRHLLSDGPFAYRLRTAVVCPTMGETIVRPGATNVVSTLGRIPSLFYRLQVRTLTGHARENTVPALDATLIPRSFDNSLASRAKQPADKARPKARR